MARVSIGMPVYSRAELLDKALHSLVNQTFQDWELLVSDDASPDPEVQRICEQYASRDERVRYVRQAKNLGGTENHLYVFENTHAPLFMWADEDDLWEPTFIEDGVAALNADPTKDAWFCQADRIDGQGELVELLPPYTRFASAGHKRREVMRFFMDPERRGKKVNFFYSLFRREVLAEAIEALVAFDHLRGSDQLFVYSFICRHDVAVSPETLFHKRVSRPLVKWHRHAKNRHFRGYYLAASGTPYQRMTALLLLPRFLWDRAYKLLRLLPRNRRPPFAGMRQTAGE